MKQESTTGLDGKRLLTTESAPEARSGNADELLRRYKAIQYLAFSMNSIEDDGELLHLFLSQCISLTGAEYGAILVPDNDPSLLKIQIAHGLDEKTVASMRFRIGQGVSGKVFQEAVPKIVGDVSLDPAYVRLRSDVKSEIAVPMAYSGSVLGVVRLDSSMPDAFDRDDTDIIVTIAGHVAQLLLRTRLKNALERKIKLRDVLIKISNSIDQVFELQDVFELAMRQLAEQFGIMRGMLVLFDREDPDNLTIASSYNLTEEESSRGIYKVGEGVIGRAVSTGKTISIPDIHKEKTFLNRTQIKRRKDIAISFIASPFRVDGQVAGVLAVEKPFESPEVLRDEEDTVSLVGAALGAKVKAWQAIRDQREALQAENTSLRQELKRQISNDSLVCKNAKMLEIMDLVNLVADSTTSIMILGESGTGKEMVARAIHAASGRRDASYVSLNCAAIPENLLESELFGYKKGAFTGAVNDKKGKFQLASGGTLFLDEIGDMPLHLQVKLLRAIQEREIEPVGSERKEKIDVRFIAATNRDLLKLIAQGSFREDLYYRLNVVEIKIPPLRERSDEIPFLVNHFIRKYSGSLGRKVEGISPQALRLLQGYAWPGNVRELENVIERAILLCRGNLIENAHLPMTLSQGTEAPADSQFISRWVASFFKTLPEPGTVWDEIIGSVEKELIHQAMLANNRNKVRTADFLGINRNTLRAKMERYNLE